MTNASQPVSGLNIGALLRDHAEPTKQEAARALDDAIATLVAAADAHTKAVVVDAITTALYPARALPMSLRGLRESEPANG